MSLRSLFGITWQSLVMPNSDPWNRFVLSYLTLMSDFYSTLHGHVLMMISLTFIGSKVPLEMSISSKCRPLNQSAIYSY